MEKDEEGEDEQENEEKDEEEDEEEDEGKDEDQDQATPRPPLDKYLYLSNALTEKYCFCLCLNFLNFFGGRGVAGHPQTTIKKNFIFSMPRLRHLFYV